MEELTEMMKDLLEVVDASDVTRAAGLIRSMMDGGTDPWEIHLGLFPVVQRVLNPPFINPHLPKMYRIYRELTPYLKREDFPSLVALEVNEYARRAKLEKMEKPAPAASPTSFDQIEHAIESRDRKRASALMGSFYEHSGGREFARRLILLGSGYLDKSLGHSISCTAFILLEMMDRADQEPWPAVQCLADYFCKGKFESTPDMREDLPGLTSEDLEEQLLRATSGRGIVNLHHPITLYATERVRELFTEHEYNHLLRVWVSFMGDKKAEKVTLDGTAVPAGSDYHQFYETFSSLDTGAALACILGMARSRQAESEIKRFLIKGVCDLYQGDYNPHDLTGLGSTLWLIDRYGWEHPIVVNGLFQYLDFFFTGISSAD